MVNPIKHLSEENFLNGLLVELHKVFPKTEEERERHNKFLAFVESRLNYVMS